MTTPQLWDGLWDWHVSPFGPSGWVARKGARSVIVTDATAPAWGPDVWRHASIARTDRMPTYDDLRLLHRAAWPDGGHAYQAFVPPAEHVNIHEFCLHLWGRADGRPVLPDFARGGTI